MPPKKAASVFRSSTPRPSPLSLFSWRTVWPRPVRHQEGAWHERTAQLLPGEEGRSQTSSPVNLTSILSTWHRSFLKIGRRSQAPGFVRGSPAPFLDTLASGSREGRLSDSRPAGGRQVSVLGLEGSKGVQALPGLVSVQVEMPPGCGNSVSGGTQ